MNTYVLGAVKPNVKQAAYDAGNLFGITTILGVGARPNKSDHPLGLALDFMTPGNSAKGDQVAQYFRDNAAKYGVTYVIWKQRIWNTGDADWQAMKDRGSVTANHFDHVHVSFKNVAVSNAGIIPGIPNPLDSLGGAANALQDLGKLVQFATDPHNWLRVVMFQVGALLIVLALLMIVFSKGDVTKALKSASKTTVRSVK